MRNLSPSGGALFRTLIEAKNAPFSESPRPSSRCHDFYPKFGQSSAVISSQSGAILETHGFPMIFLKFRKILGNLSPSGDTLFGPLIEAKNAPFSPSFRSPRRDPDFPREIFLYICLYNLTMAVKVRGAVYCIFGSHDPYTQDTEFSFCELKWASVLYAARRRRPIAWVARWRHNKGPML